MKLQTRGISGAPGRLSEPPGGWEGLLRPVGVPLFVPSCWCNYCFAVSKYFWVSVACSSL